MSDLRHDTEPRIRVYDVVAQGSSGDGLTVKTGRHLDLPVPELARLLALLGADGMQAFCLYLEHLEHVPGVDGELSLGVPHFSARWLHAASHEAAERTQIPGLTKNAATRGHQAVERSGLLHALANPPAVAGQGARGRTWRAVLNPRLVVIHGGRDDLDDVPKVRRGRPRKESASPDSRFPGKRDPGPSIPGPGSAENQLQEPVSPFWRNRGTGDLGVASSLVSPGLPGSGTADSTSAVGVVQGLLSSRARPGLLATGLVPVLQVDRAGVLVGLRPLFNDLPVAERSQETVATLGLPLEETRRPDVLADLIVTTLLGERDTVADLRQLGVSGPPLLPVEELQERLVVGWLIGWGLRRVGSWGAWLYQVTRPGWSPKPGPLLDRLLYLVRSRTLSPSPPVDRPPTVPVRPLVAVEDGKDHPPGEDRPSSGEPLLPEATIARHFTAARQKWPMLCRDGSAQASDPVWRSRLVRMYLAERERQSVLEATEQVVSR